MHVCIMYVCMHACLHICICVSMYVCMYVFQNIPQPISNLSKIINSSYREKKIAQLHEPGLLALEPIDVTCLTHNLARAITRHDKFHAEHMIVMLSRILLFKL